ncbi:hypothetical protein HYDPIDRAFT_100710 [Hydnomerulius pinastri MD-312]|uniref:Uncharacterized protein n=1 Tax=Hydnomerulius pinastri MD-312 TaxID=994086 RepID=A0A0C9V2E6_9AGAM|nr:hypothetical protein HYDPIDRAFT_100710 [Hydnomerulius pinastri MD-312]
MSALANTLGKALAKSKSGSVPGLGAFFNALARAFNRTCLRVRIHVRVPARWWRVFNSGHGQPRDCDSYPTPRAEARYWRVAGRYRRRLYSGDTITAVANSSSSRAAGSHGDSIPLVTYYTPRLLPLYREHQNGKRRSTELEADAGECWITPKTFCKWHRMVFQGSRHPTLAQASERMKYHSNQDLREIQRIARLLPDEQVFRSRGKGKAKWSIKYKNMWKSWLERKGTDLVIVFE